MVAELAALELRAKLQQRLAEQEVLDLLDWVDLEHAELPNDRLDRSVGVGTKNASRWRGRYDYTVTSWLLKQK